MGKLNIEVRVRLPLQLAAAVQKASRELQWWQMLKMVSCA
jgi:hypothetical protein